MRGRPRGTKARGSWRERGRECCAKQWYGIGRIILDVKIVGTIPQSTGPSQVWPILYCVANIVGLGHLERKGLRRFWPPKHPM